MVKKVGDVSLDERMGRVHHGPELSISKLCELAGILDKRSWRPMAKPARCFSNEGRVYCYFRQWIYDVALECWLWGGIFVKPLFNDYLRI